MAPGLTEEEVASRVVAMFVDLGWDVYQEVACWQMGPIADIVAVLDQPRRCHIVEVKRGPSLSLLAQAWEWLDHRSANMVSVAYQGCRRTKGNRAFRRACVSQGIGVFEVQSNTHQYSPSVSCLHKPRLIRPHRNWKRTIRDRCREEHRSGDYAAAGSIGGGHFTPFKATCAAVLAAVKQSDGGLTMRELMGKIDHHYSTDATARSTILRRIDEGLVPGVCRADGRPARIVLKTEEN